MVKKFYRILESRRRRRSLGKIRREFAKAGYPLDRFRDAQLEVALRYGRNDIAGVTVNAHTIYRTLKRLEVIDGVA